MNTYLFAWNPKKWNWDTLLKDIDTVQKKGYVTRVWSSSNGNIRPGDRAFLVKLGVEPRGIIASGYVSSFPELLPHYNDKGKLIKRTHVDFDILLDPEKVMSIKALSYGKTTAQHWSPQSSGILIRPEVVPSLELLWYNFLNETNMINESLSESDNDESYKEGEKTFVSFMRYQRNKYAREKCIEKYGCDCYICGFNFEKTYGEIGANFIHVHHLKPLSDIDSAYFVNPATDLRPVCPNCHAMLHKTKPPLSMDAIKNLLINISSQKTS